MTIRTRARLLFLGSLLLAATTMLVSFELTARLCLWLGGFGPAVRGF